MMVEPSLISKAYRPGGRVDGMVTVVEVAVRPPNGYALAGSAGPVRLWTAARECISDMDGDSRTAENCDSLQVVLGAGLQGDGDGTGGA